MRLIDLTLIRIGSEQYADENATFGAATLRRDHVTIRQPRGLAMRFTGKSGIEHEHLVEDAQLFELALALRRRRSGPADFFVYREGRRWVDLTSTQINAYIQRHTSADHSAKDFRTRGATVLAAVALARLSGQACESSKARRNSLKGVIEEISDILGNTPSVCKSSYIDPRVLDMYLDGQVIDLSERQRNGSVTRRAAISSENAVRSLIGSR